MVKASNTVNMKSRSLKDTLLFRSGQELLKASPLSKLNDRKMLYVYISLPA